MTQLEALLGDALRSCKRLDDSEAALIIAGRIWEALEEHKANQISIDSPLISIDFYRSGIDAGKIGYTINTKRVTALGAQDFEDLLDSISSLPESVTIAGRRMQGSPRSDGRVPA